MSIRKYDVYKTDLRVWIVAYHLCKLYMLVHMAHGAFSFKTCMDDFVIL